MKLIIMGCPGAGKGTQAKYICEKYGIPLISASELLRNAIINRKLDADIQKAMEAGELVPDEVIIKLIKEQISQPGAKDGYLLDGFPRTIPQSQALMDAAIEIDYVIEVYVTDEEVIDRLAGRRIHLPSGRIYHTRYKPPKLPDQDDITGEPLVQREDDNEETIRKRLEIYHQQAELLCRFYKNLSKTSNTVFLRVDGSGSVEEVQDRIFSLL